MVNGAIVNNSITVPLEKITPFLKDAIIKNSAMVDKNGDKIPEYQQIDQAKLVPLLTSALQEAITKIETLETKVTALEAK